MIEDIKTIFLDLDGVLVDFVGGLHRVLGAAYDIDNYPYEKGKWGMLTDIKQFNGAPATFEQCNEVCTQNFWVNLGWMHDGHDILRLICATFDPDDIFLLTAPMPNTGSASGKMEWINKNLPAYRDRVFIATASKSIMARPGTLLIDDRDKNIDEFEAKGGHGLLVPRPWNRGHTCAHQALGVVGKCLEYLKYE